MNFSNRNNESLFSRTNTPQHKFSIYDETWGVQAQQQQSQDNHYEETIANLTAQINQKDQEIATLRTNNEVLVAAMYQTNTPMPVGEADAVEITHRIVCRLNRLQAENEKLMLKANGIYAAQLEAELSNMRRDLALLKSANR